jgi:hypothetical protein
MQNSNTKPVSFLGLKNEKATAVKTLLFSVVFSVLGCLSANAQLTATGEVRTRTELNTGQGTLQKFGENAALFTSQRTRLNVGFTGYRYKFFASVQDVRVWGQDASTNNRVTTAVNDGVMLNEAWGEIILNDTISTIQNLSLKLGRQPISYDDQKILGGLDWLQQGRRHDAAILKFANKGWTADLGVAFNQNGEKANGVVYNGIPVTGSGYGAGTNGIGTMYKSFQYLYVGKKFAFTEASFLFFKDDFNKYLTTTAGTPAVTIITPEAGVWSRNTVGFYFNSTIKRKLNLVGNLYQQWGTDKDGRTIDANLASLTATYQIGRKLFVGPGVDYLSGDDGTNPNNGKSNSQRFDPLYGTPHKFWGYMDYFYVASGFGRNGLVNYFFKAKYNAKDNLTFFADIHGFSSANKVSDGKGGLQTRYLGTELDLMMRYGMTKMINIEAGYSVMSATRTMISPQVKNVTGAKVFPQWAYVMVTIKPNFLNKK